MKKKHEIKLSNTAESEEKFTKLFHKLIACSFKDALFEGIPFGPLLEFLHISAENWLAVVLSSSNHKLKKDKLDVICKEEFWGELSFFLSKLNELNFNPKESKFIKEVEKAQSKLKKINNLINTKDIKLIKSQLPKMILNSKENRQTSHLLPYLALLPVLKCFEAGKTNFQSPEELQCLLTGFLLGRFLEMCQSGIINSKNAKKTKQDPRIVEVKDAIRKFVKSRQEPTPKALKDYLIKQTFSDFILIKDTGKRTKSVAAKGRQFLLINTHSGEEIELTRLDKLIKNIQK